MNLFTSFALQARTFSKYLVNIPNNHVWSSSPNFIVAFVDLLIHVKDKLIEQYN